MLANNFNQLPSFFRILITSRPEHDLVNVLRHQPHIFDYELDINSNINKSDIELYLQSQLKRIRLSKPTLEASWPGGKAVQALCTRSAGLFIWCSTAIGFLGSYDPENKLKILLEQDLQGKAKLSLYSLYKLALEASEQWEEDNFEANFCAIMGAVLVAREPLSHTTIDELLGLKPFTTKETLQYFACLLKCNDTEPVQVLHPSFADYLSSSECRDEKWYIHISTHVYKMVYYCFNLMKKKLHFNICGLETSHVQNSDIQDLDKKITLSIPPALQYACLFWSEHLQNLPKQDRSGDQLQSNLKNFLHVNFLYWLEVLSLVGKLAIARASMQNIATLLRVSLLIIFM